MTIYRLQLQSDKSVKILETSSKPLGMVLNPSLSFSLLTKYPRLGNGKIFLLRASQMLIDINKWTES